MEYLQFAFEVYHGYVIIKRLNASLRAHFFGSNKRHTGSRSYEPCSEMRFNGNLVLREELLDSIMLQLGHIVSAGGSNMIVQTDHKSRGNGGNFILILLDNHLKLEQPSRHHHSIGVPEDTAFFLA